MVPHPHPRLTYLLALEEAYQRSQTGLFPKAHHICTNVTALVSVQISSHPSVSLFSGSRGIGENAGLGLISSLLCT